MVNYSNVYKGANYGFEPPAEEDPFGKPIADRYTLKAGQFGLALDPRTANQLKEVTDKLNTGAKTLEVQGLSGDIVESIPDQHFQEIARLRKLAGADITFHGPLVEPTGFNQQGGWEEANRVQAERQIWDAVRRGQQMMLKDVKKGTYEDTNLVVTLHTSNGLISPQTIVKKEGEKKVGVEFGEVKNIAVIDEYSGKAGYIPIEEDKFESPGKLPKPEEEIERLNRKAWNGEVTNLNVEVERGRNAINEALKLPALRRTTAEGGETVEKGKEIEKLREIYKMYRDDPTTYSEMMKKDEELMKDDEIDTRVTQLAYGEGFVRDAYDRMKDMYAQALYGLESQKDAESQEALKRLKEYRQETAEKLIEYKKDPLKVKEFADKVSEGMRLFSTLPTKGIPRKYKPVQEFAVDKASETFANVAVNSYKTFKEHAPILSIENPPVGMGLSRADEMVPLIEKTREKVAQKLQEQANLSKEEAKRQSEKLVGVTWDVGHINMIKKYGFTNEDLAHETEKMKNYIQHVHLSDNFGIEHTELPMGMGNVPMDKHLKEIGGKIKDMKAIIETGNWYQHFRTSPLPETLAAFGSQLYPMQMQPYWDQAQAMALSGGYFSGYGTNPDVHHSIYGAGFSGLPVELGGQIGGTRGRLSGNPME